MGELKMGYDPQKSFQDAEKHEKEAAELRAKQQAEVKPQVKLAHTEALEENRLGDARKMVAEYELYDLITPEETRQKLDEIVEEFANLVEENWAKKLYLEDLAYKGENRTKFNDKIKMLSEKFEELKMLTQEKGDKISFEDAAGKQKNLKVVNFLRDEIAKRVKERNGEFKKDIAQHAETFSDILATLY
jgi:hypothetical protein